MSHLREHAIEERQRTAPRIYRYRRAQLISDYKLIIRNLTCYATYATCCRLWATRFSSSTFSSSMSAFTTVTSTAGVFSVILACAQHPPSVLCCLLLGSPSQRQPQLAAFRTPPYPPESVQHLHVYQRNNKTNLDTNYILTCNEYSWVNLPPFPRRGTCVKYAHLPSSPQFGP